MKRVEDYAPVVTVYEPMSHDVDELEWMLRQVRQNIQTVTNILEEGRQTLRERRLARIDAKK